MNKTVVRAFEIPLQRMSGEIYDPKTKKYREATADELWSTLRECFKQTSMLSNWCVHRLMVNDVVRTPDMTKLPPMPKIKLYDQAGKAFGLMKKDSWWAGASGSFAAITKRVADYWKKHRFAILWNMRGRENPPSFDDTQPFPVRSQEWCEVGYDGIEPFVGVNLPSGTPRKPLKARLYLRGKRGTKDAAEFSRQLAHLKRVIEGDAKKLELVIRQERVSLSCHRPTVTDREPGGGEQKHYRVMVKMVGRLEVNPKPGELALVLSHDPNAFWVAETADVDQNGKPINSRPAWVLNADHVKRMFEWLAVHEDRLARYAQDTKAERRMSNDKRRQLNESRERCCFKHEKRMKSWLHEVTAHLVGFAVRQRAGVVFYKDVDQSFIPRFPWYILRQRLKDKLEAVGIVCHCQTDGEESITEVA